MLTTLSALPGEPYALDGLTPESAFRPTSTEEAATLLAWAHGAGKAVVPWGGGTHQAIGNRLGRYDVALLTGGLSGIVDHQPADLTLTVRAGTTLEAVQRYLAPFGQTLPLEAESPELATIGGLLATGTTGPLRLSAGSPRDLTLWVEAVRPDGTVVHGGAKVVKNVAGYDTPKLFIGSLGSAGLLTAATFRIAPAPVAASTLLAGFRSAEAAEPFLAELIAGRLLPSLVSLVKGRLDWGGPFAVGPWVVAVGGDGAADTVDWQMAAFDSLARVHGAQAILPLAGDASAQARRALMARRGGGTLGLVGSVLPTQVAPLLHALEPGGFWQAFAEVGNGALRLEWDEATPDWREAADRIEALGGAWRLVRCPLGWKDGLDVWGPARGDRPLMRRLKAAMDPRGVLNPGRFAGG